MNLEGFTRYMGTYDGAMYSDAALAAMYSICTPDDAYDPENYVDRFDEYGTLDALLAAEADTIAERFDVDEDLGQMPEAQVQGLLAKCPWIYELGTSWLVDREG